MKDDGTLSNPVKMLEIADVVTRNLTIDEGLASIPTLLTVGNRLKNIDVGKVAFVAVPDGAGGQRPEPPAGGRARGFPALRGDAQGH